MTQTPPGPLRWGVLGSARIVETGLAPAIARDQRCVLTAVASRSAAQADEFARRFGAECSYGDYSRLLEDDHVDVVYIPLPNSLHCHWAVEALRAGKHVLVEKPLALTGEDARTMFAAAEEAGRLLIEGFMWRYHPRVERIRQLIRDEVGPLHLVRVAYTYDLAGSYKGGPKAGMRDIRLSQDLCGGALADIGSYTVSGLRTYADARPLRVSSRLLREEQGVDIRFCGEILFDSGAVGQFYVGMDIPGGALLDVHGERGRLRMANAFRTAAEWGDPVIEVLPYDGPAREEIVPFANQFDLEVSAIASVLLDGETPLIGPSDSIENADTLDAIRQSWNGNTVDMPLRVERNAIR